MSDILSKTINQQESHSRQLVEPDRSTSRIIANSQSLEVYGSITIIDSQGIGSAFILGHSTNSELGAGTGLTLGEGDKDAIVRERVIPPIAGGKYDFRDWFDTQNFVDSSNTTATVSTASQNITFSSGDTYRSSTILDSGGTITSAVLETAGVESGPGSFSYYLTADGGSNWESVTLSVEHEFSNTGTDLRLRIDVSGSTGTVSINNSGIETPIKVLANKN